MYTGEYSILTFILYISLGITCLLSIREQFKLKKKPDIPNARNNNPGLFLLLFVLLFFTALKKVDVNFGGADALNYKNDFINCLSVQIDWTKWYSEEFVYLIFEKTIRSVTNSYIIFFIICYGFILCSYYFFIKEYSDENTSCIPFVLMVFPFLKSWCTLKTGLAVAVFLFGVRFLKKNRVLGSLLICTTFFIHRMSIIYVLFFVYYLLFKKYYQKVGRIRWIFLCIAFIIASYVVSLRMQNYVLAASFLDSTDYWYLSRMVGQNIFSRWPMYFAQSLLLIAIFLVKNRIPRSEKTNDIILFCTYDFMVLPASLVLGFWRVNEYFYMARLIAWGYVITATESYFTERSRIIIKSVFLILFILWLIFRISSECFDLKIMPYLFL